MPVRERGDERWRMLMDLGKQSVRYRGTHPASRLVLTNAMTSLVEVNDQNPILIEHSTLLLTSSSLHAPPLLQVQLQNPPPPCHPSLSTTWGATLEAPLC